MILVKKKLHVTKNEIKKTYTVQQYVTFLKN